MEDTYIGQKQQQKNLDTLSIGKDGGKTRILETLRIGNNLSHFGKQFGNI